MEAIKQLTFREAEDIIIKKDKIKGIYNVGEEDNWSKDFREGLKNEDNRRD